MAGEKPNVVFILTDDQGPWAAGCYGNSEIRTPNLDRIAASGVRFENFFVTIPVCSPSRASFLTGRIPSQHGVHDFLADGNTGPAAASFLEDEVCYTDVLAENGWTCGLSGKWHLGNSTLPQHGFTHWFAHERGGGEYNDATMVRHGELVTVPGYVTTAITEDALEFLDTHAGNAAPFYLSVHYTAPHSPWNGHPQDIVDSYGDCPFESCPQEELHPWAKFTKIDPDGPYKRGSGLSQNMGNRESLKGYFAAVTAMDYDVGRILDRLEERSIRENTLVVFTSDNGYSCGHHGFWGKGNGTSPVNMFENSIKVPFLATHPGQLPEGSVQKAMVSNYDFFPTLLDYLNLPLPEGCNLPGESFLSALRGEDDTGRKSVIVYDEYGPTRMIRTAEWKYIHRYPDGPNELYGLVDDPDERSNLVEDDRQAGRIKEMKGQMETWFREYIVPEKDGREYSITGSGQNRPVGLKWEDGKEPFN